MPSDEVPEKLSDEDLYTEYQHVKEHGPQLRLDELQLEISQRWEDEFRRRDDDE